MAKATAFVGGLVCGLALGTLVLVGHAQDPQTDVQQAAAAAGVDPIQLAGAANTVGVDAWVYARSEGLLERAATSPAVLPLLSARVECIIARESGGANVANSRGSGAVGVAQYLPSTFAAHAAEMGHPEWSPWRPDEARAVAAHDLALGRRAQWTVGGC